LFSGCVAFSTTSPFFLLTHLCVWQMEIRHPQELNSEDVADDGAHSLTPQP
jgi:hypothetical protein